MRLPDLARERADELALREIAALENFQRRDQLALEQLRAAAVMRERGQRLDDGALAHVGDAEIRLQPPDREDDLRRHAGLPLDRAQKRPVALQPLLRAGDSALGDARPRIILEALAKRAALAVVEIDDLAIERHAGEGLIDDVGANARRFRVARHLAEEGVEVAAAARGECRRGEERKSESGENAFVYALVHEWPLVGSTLYNVTMGLVARTPSPRRGEGWGEGIRTE